MLNQNQTQSYLKDVEVKNHRGIHARPAQEIMSIANKYQSKVEISFDRTTADAKSILDLMTLLAPKGSLLQVKATGPDAQSAVEDIVTFINLLALETDH